MAKKEKVVKGAVTPSKKRTSVPILPSEQKNPIWLFTNLDRDGDFAFDVNRDDFDYCDFLEKMISYSNMTWAEIKRQTHDRGKSKNHMLSYDKLSVKAKERFRVKQLSEDEDAIFSFALNNKVRIIGIKKNEFFHVLWYDPRHEVCPSKLKHT